MAYNMWYMIMLFPRDVGQFAGVIVLKAIVFR